MKNIFLKSVFTLLIIAGMLTSCVNSDTYGVPENTLQTYELTTTKTVAQIIALNTTSTPVLITTDDVIEAYVTSSDEKGNFFKSVSFQDFKNTSATIKGFSVPVNISTLFGKGFTPGRKVYIKLKGLYIANVFGSTQIGYPFEGSIGRIPENVWQNHLFPSSTVVPESELVREMTVATAFDDVNQNTLIDLKPVQFDESSLNRTYYDVDSGGGATNHSIVSTSGGTSRVLRISSFAPFSGNKVPSGSGTIRGVLTKFSSTFQFMVRYENDIKLSNPRADTTPSLGGTNIQYLGSFTENFESYPASTNTFPKYINDAFLGTKYWATESFSSNKYLRMSNFSSNTAFQEQNNKAYFIIPVDFTAANSMSFKTQDRFNVGNVLKVYYSTNYIPFGKINEATLINITSNFTIASGTTGSTSQPFVNSGSFNFPTSLTGNGFIIFEYTGGYSFNPDLTTTMHIDDIVVN